MMGEGVLTLVGCFRAEWAGNAERANAKAGAQYAPAASAVLGADRVP